MEWSVDELKNSIRIIDRSTGRLQWLFVSSLLARLLASLQAHVVFVYRSRPSRFRVPVFSSRCRAHLRKLAFRRRLDRLDGIWAQDRREFDRSCDWVGVEWLGLCHDHPTSLYRKINLNIIVPHFRAARASHNDAPHSQRRPTAAAATTTAAAELQPAQAATTTVVPALIVILIILLPIVLGFVVVIVIGGWRRRRWPRPAGQSRGTRGCGGGVHAAGAAAPPAGAGSQGG